MTELDMIRRAQMYMEKLSHGINPLDGTPVADGDLIRNGRMSRCFAFVAEVLDKVVTNSAPHAEKTQPAAPKSAPAAPAQSGPRSLPPELAAMLRPASSIKPSPRTKAAPVGGSEAKHRLPPAVPYNRRANFAYSDRPLPVEEVVQRIHALEPENTEPLSVSPLLDWLTDAGLLAWMPDSRGGYAYLPTQSGGEVGILVEPEPCSTRSPLSILSWMRSTTFWTRPPVSFRCAIHHGRPRRTHALRSCAARDSTPRRSQKRSLVRPPPFCSACSSAVFKAIPHN